MPLRSARSPNGLGWPPAAEPTGELEHDDGVFWTPQLARSVGAFDEVGWDVVRVDGVPGGDRSQTR